MQFSDILTLHRSVAADNSLPEVLGDAFLLHENPIYRRVRDEAVRIGCRFQSASADYLLLPFNQLERILATKEIPYVPNARLLADVETRRPGVFDLARMPMPESYHLHESAHVIAEARCEALVLTAPEDRILKMILCESFANTVDAMACGYARTPLHQILLKLNCYMEPKATTIAAMERVGKTLGTRALTSLILHAYIAANFFKDDVEPTALEAILAAAKQKMTKKIEKDVRVLREVGQRLDPLFRVQTTQNFLHMAGFQGEIYDLLDFDVYERLRRPDFAGAVDALLSVLSDPNN